MDLSASSHPRAGGLTAAALPDASAASRYNSKFGDASDPR